jgi:hypothetical protein
MTGLIPFSGKHRRIPMTYLIPYRSRSVFWEAETYSDDRSYSVFWEAQTFSNDISHSLFWEAEAYSSDKFHSNLGLALQKSHLYCVGEQRKRLFGSPQAPNAYLLSLTILPDWSTFLLQR